MAKKEKLLCECFVHESHNFSRTLIFFLGYPLKGPN